MCQRASDRISTPVSAAIRAAVPSIRANLASAGDISTRSPEVVDGP
jgi:hypothetical protein